MKKIYKLATLLIVLCMCFVITGCFGTVDSMTKKYSEAKKENIKTECKSNLKNIATACEMYAADHEGRYPKNLDVITKDGYMKILPKCPIDDCEYKFLSKFYPKNEEHGNVDYYIIKCQKHPLLFDYNIGLMDLEADDEHNSIHEYYNLIKNGSATEYVRFTDDELKELGIK